jgi:hypothetical protein
MADQGVYFISKVIQKLRCWIDRRNQKVITGSCADKSETDLQTAPKGAPWKAGIARMLRIKTTAGNPWIAKRLNMGHPSRVTNLIRELTDNE